MRKALMAAIAAALLMVGIGTGLTPADAATKHIAKLSVFHGIPGVPVDVYVNGKRVLNDFQPGTFAGPLRLTPGAYRVTIVAADAQDDSDPVIGPVTVRLKVHRRYTVAAHLTAAGEPTATLYTDTKRTTPKGQGRLIVRHVAAAPTVDIFANGERSMTGLINPRQSKLDVKAGSYSVEVALTRTTAPVIGPATVKVRKHQNTIVYAWGSAADSTLAAAVQTSPTH